MVTFGMLWMPIILAAILVFIASFVIWMVSPHHKSDWKGVPEEGSFLEALRSQKITPGQYMFPYASTMKESGTPEFAKKCEEGPVGFLTLKPSAKPAMGKPIVLSFIYYLGVSFLVAYVTGRTLAPSTHYLAVFRVAGAVAVIAYCGALFPSAIWFGRSWRMTWKEVVDGIAYGLLTAGAFGWLWPR